jgi:hypothetical protein
MDIPDIRYAKTVDGIHIAYEVVGEGPVDLVYVPVGRHGSSWHGRTRSMRGSWSR